MSKELIHSQYGEMLRSIIAEIKSTRVTIAQRINSGMMQMYWNIGKRLSFDLQQEFPGTTGFSPRNLWNMKNFYEFYALTDEKVQRNVALLPWRHNILIISKTKTIDEAVFYTNTALELGLTHDVLLNFIKADSYKNAKILPKHHNFAHTLPEHLQEQAN